MKRYLIALFILFTIFHRGHTNAEDIIVSQGYLEQYKPQLKLAKTFQDWNVYHQISHNSIKCHAIISPYRTKAFEGVRESPYLVISYKGHMQYTISLDSGFVVDQQNGIILKTNNRSYILNAALPRTAWTSSSVQDKAIIEDMIKDSRNFSIRSYNTSDDTALDFYSLNGLALALQYMEKNCLTFYD